MVKHVKHFRAELEANPVIRCDAGVLDKSKVPVVYAIPANVRHYPTHVPEREGSRLREAVDVEPFIEPGFRTTGDSWTILASGRAGNVVRRLPPIAGCVGVISDKNGVAPLEGGDALQSPAFDDLVDHARGVMEEFLPMTNGQIEHIAQHEPLGYVKR